MEQFNFNVEEGLMKFLNDVINSAVDYLLDNRKFKKVNELRNAISYASSLEKLSLSYVLFLVSEFTNTSLEDMNVNPHHFGLILQSELNKKGHKKV
ncbi:hypothetical protein L3V83_12145 [Thiotrichales bacterium 19X7-9]|nr:hypothetical protein [Thiotrichales bacterium 19X7-9]